MRRGGKILASAAILTIAGCGEEGKLTVRPVAASAATAAAANKPVPVRIAEAHHHMALGNVGLALEAFRKAAREDPASVDAFAGIAACYDRMGRFDLSRRYYEAALALAPADPHVLGALAASLDLQGRRDEAARVRSEVAARLAAVAAPAEPPPTLTASLEPAGAEQVPVDVAVPRGQAVTIALPPPRPAPVVAAAAATATQAKPEPIPVKVAPPRGQSVTIALLPPRPAPAAPAAITAATPKPAPAVPTIVAAAAAIPAAPAAQATPPRGRSVTIALPPPRPAPAAAQQRTGPRLERISPVEVALITAPGPRWKAQMADRAGLRFVPLREASYNQGPIRLLNAARVHRLAARTRSNLTGRGWSEITIGDAAVIRPRSLIVYPAGQREVAARLSAQTGIAMAERAGVRMVTILLGRDAAGHPALRTRSS